jgi:hypothetical protein
MHTATPPTTNRTPPTRRSRQALYPFMLAVPFTTVILGLMNLSDHLPLPAALTIGAAWGVALGALAMWVQTKPRLRAWTEDAFVVAGIFGLAFAGCGGLMALLIIGGALDSPTLTGETLVAMFLPTIPYYIIATAPMELLIIPGLLFLAWRPGARRALIVSSAILYFLFRLWSYLVFVSARMDFAGLEHSNTPLGPVEAHQAHQLLVDDQRWILVLVILALLILAAHLPATARLRQTTQR